MSATEIHNFLTTRPSVAAMRSTLKAEGFDGFGPYRPFTKVEAERKLLDLYLERRGY